MRFVPEVCWSVVVSFLWSGKNESKNKLRGISLKNISWKPVCPTIDVEKCQIYDIKVIGKYVYESKNESVHFYSYPRQNPPRFLSWPVSPKQREIKKHFLKFYFSLAEKGKYYGSEKMIKIKLARGSIPPSLQSFTFLVSVLPSHNLNSSKLKWEGSLTLLIKFSLKSIVCWNNGMKDKIWHDLIF